MAKGPTERSSSAIGHWDGHEMELGWRFAYPSEFIPVLRRYLGFRPGMRILDVGTGSSFFARLVAHHVPRTHLTGLDADPQMLAVAQDKVQAAKLDHRIRIVSGNAYGLPFDDDSFHAATSHLLLCILNDPQAALSEQIRVVRPGGIVSAVICFCRTDRIPRYHGRWGMEGDQRIDMLNQQFNQVWRRAIRPRLLDLDHDIVNQEVAWHFRRAGLLDIHVNGHLAVSAPGDNRTPLAEAAEFASEMHRMDIDRLRRQWAEYGAELGESGFPREAYEELLELKVARADRLETDPHLVREAMEIHVEPMLLLRGTVPKRA